MLENRSGPAPLESRTFRCKIPAVEFFCPLCRSERAINIHYKLKASHYVRIGVVSVSFSFFLWPFIGKASLFSLFFIWAIYEGTLRILWRKEIPCPYCGFDASYYKTDIKMAQEKVKAFWNKKKAFQKKGGPQEN